jgi:uncharacterized YigZ family protein
LSKTKLEYKTFRRYFQNEFKERSSRFICFGIPVKSKDEAILEIDKIKSRYFGAKHYVYAFSLCDGYRKFCGDGEPRGSAGEPVAKIIKSYELKNALVVIVRYFGGTLLGIGGVVKAYTRGAQMAVDGCGLKILRLCIICNTKFDYSFLKKFSNVLSFFKAKILSVVYSECVKSNFCCYKLDFDKLEEKLFESSSGNFNFSISGEDYFEV